MEPLEELIQVFRLPSRFLKIDRLQSVGVPIPQPIVLIHNIYEADESWKLYVTFVLRLKFIRHRAQPELPHRIKI
jgi:hypothetical protein